MNAVNVASFLKFDLEVEQSMSFIHLIVELWPAFSDLLSVTIDRRTNIEEIKLNKTVKSYFTCSLSSLLGVWMVWEPFQFFFFENRKNKTKTEQLQNHPDTEERRQRTSKV